MIIRSFAIVTLICSIALSSPTNAADAQRTQKLIATLQKADAPFFDKARACQQLGEVGTPETVPVLAALLNDEHLAAYARSGLENIPDPSAAEALRNALGTVKGLRLVGVINSLGAIRDGKPVPELCKLASDPGMAKHSLLALGRISTPESIAFLQNALASGTEQSRADTAAACILAAEQQLSSGNLDTAIKLYDAVRSAKVPASYRIAAIRGAILARKGNGVPLLIEQLEFTDAAARTASLTTIREMPGERLADALNAELGKANPELQCQIMTAMIDCRNERSVGIIRAKVTNENATVRETALTVIGSIGGISEGELLIDTILKKPSETEYHLAETAIRKPNFDGIEPIIAGKLATAKDPETRVRLIRLLGTRKTTAANAELLRQAASPESAVAVHALGALGDLATTNELPRMIALDKTVSDSTVRTALEASLGTACERLGDSACAYVLAELQNSPNAKKPLWVRILCGMGCSKALPALKSILSGADEGLAATTLEQLGKWPDPTPVDALLAFADATNNSNLRAKARGSVIQLAGNAVDEHQRPDPVVVDWLRRAVNASNSEQMRQTISVLARVKNVESFRVLQPMLSVQGVKLDAARALIQIAPALNKSEVAPALKQELLKITPELNSDLSARAAKIAATIE